MKDKKNAKDKGNEMEMQSEKYTDSAKDEEKSKPAKQKHEFKMPHEKRHGCTDVLCLIIFLIFCVVEIIVLCIGFTFGNPWLLIAPSDSNGRICGYTEEVKNKPHLAFYDLISCAQLGYAILWTGCPTKQVCVEECPAEYWIYHIPYALESFPGMKVN